MTLLNDIRATRRRVRSKAEILRGIKDAPLAGDMNRSMALGEADRRHRSGPEAAAGTGQRYNPDQFWVDSDGKLNLRVRDLLRELDELPDDGGPSVGGAKRFQFLWRKGLTANHSIADGFIGEMAGFNSPNDDTVYFHAILPDTMPLTKDFDVTFIMQVNADPNPFTLSVEVYNTDSGTLTTKSADQTITVNGDASGLSINELFTETFTVSAASALTANTRSVWLKTVATSITGTVDIYIPEVYGEWS